MGSSHFCALSASAYLTRQGIDSKVISASSLLHYELPGIDRNTLLIMISQSGESAEIVSLLDVLPPCGCLAGITNRTDSTLAGRSELVLHLNVPEESTVSTRTYTASFLYCHVLSHLLTGTSPAEEQDLLSSALQGIDSLLKASSVFYDPLKDFLQDCHIPYYIGRGYSLSTAYAAALFTQEAAKIPGVGTDGGEFRHGPFEVLSPDFYCVILAPDGITWELSCRMALEIGQKGGHVVLLTNRMPETSEIDIWKNIFPISYSALPEDLSPALDIVPIQFMIHALAEHHRNNPNIFLHASKVTTTQ